MPSMPSMPSMSSIDARQIERAVERGRERMESIADSISHELTQDNMNALIEGLRQEAVPMVERAMPMIELAVERATGRKKRRARSKMPFVVAAVVAVAGILAYLLWQRRDEQPAYLLHTPDDPDIKPVSMPPSAPSAGPSDPAPSDDGSARETPIATPDAVSPAREFAGTTHATFGLGPRDERPIESSRPPGTARVPFATSPVQLPGNPRRSWLPR